MNASGKKHSKKSGFTIVELLTVIVVIGILAAITIFSVGAWRTRTAKTEVKNDLANVASAMENARNFGNTYPAAIPSTFTASKNVTITLKYSTGDTYCVEGKSKASSGVLFNIHTGETTPAEGGC